MDGWSKFNPSRGELEKKKKRALIESLGYYYVGCEAILKRLDDVVGCRVLLCFFTYMKMSKQNETKRNENKTKGSAYGRSI